MDFDSIDGFAASLRGAGHGSAHGSGHGAGRGSGHGAGPIALVLIEDMVEVESTLAHHLDLGFARVAAFLPEDLDPVDLDDPRLDWIRADTRSETANADIVNAVIRAAPPGQWLFYCYNAEYLVFPFREDRSIADLCAFVVEERRDVVACVTVDLYAADLEAHPSGVAREAAWFDRIGYFAHGRHDPQGRALDRQVDIHGGLRWRFEEHVPSERRQICRSALFRAAPELRLAPDHRFDRDEYNTLQCPWHRSPTAATVSFRTAKALRRNPASRERIQSFDWPGSARFDWSSRQLLDLGLIEPGQWF